MPSRVYGDIDFICKSESSGGGGYVPLRVTQMSLAHAKWWDAYIQPSIDQDTSRADVGWNWPLIHSATTAVAKAARQDPVGYVVGVELSNGFLPCAMIKLVRRYKDLEKPERDAVFLWYLSDAPRDALIASGFISGDDAPKLLGTLSLDVALTASFKRGMKGRMGLHAAKEGGNRLFRWYLNKGMKNLDGDLSLGFRTNDGRYFVYDEARAFKASKGLDKFRNRVVE